MSVHTVSPGLWTRTEALPPDDLGDSARMQLQPAACIICPASIVESELASQQFPFKARLFRVFFFVSNTICMPIFFAALFTIAKRWKQSKCPLMDETINKMWFIHTIKYYSPLRRKEILTHAAIWMNHGNISKTGQIQRHKQCMIASGILEE